MDTLALRLFVRAAETLKGRKLADDTRVLAASPAYLAAHGAPQSPADLAAHQLIAFRDKTPKPLITSDAGDDARFDPSGENCALVFDDGRSLRLATLAGAGISAHSLWSIHEDLRAGRLVRVLERYRLAEDIGLWLIYPQANVLSPKVRYFMDYLLKQIGRSPPWMRA